MAARQQRTAEQETALPGDDVEAAQRWNGPQIV
jgi:hypothetical protein